MSVRRGIQTIMRAIRVNKFGGPDVLQLESNVPIPKAKETEILIKVSAVGVNPVDTYKRAGTYSVLPELPYVPGSDTAGVVEEVGTAVKKFQKGDRVCTVFKNSGAYAEYTVCDEKFACYLPDNLTFDQGAGIGTPFFTAYRSIFQRAGAKPGETILVHGASGGVGTACVQIAKAHGMRVLGTAGSEAGLELVKKLGADAVFNHREEGYTDKIKAATKDDGVDVILEMLSNVNLQKDLEMIKLHGRIVNIGARGTVEINPRLTLSKECTVTGVALGNSSEGDWKEMCSAIEAWMKHGWVNPKVGKTYPLDKASLAHEEIIKTTSARGNIILKP
ncbi:quinone oxidoreductase-like isoform X2 [Gigantopelta aegis]|nr:quinone oxidoreductase-like isoform X2 [Gigantopelta aegis]